jgi:hypothetical protein
MDNVTSILDSPLLTKLRQQPMQPSERTPMRTRFLKETLLELTRMNLLTNSNPEALSKIYQTWAAGLDDLPDAAIRFGLSRAKDCTDFFSLPVFRELCRVTAEDLGLLGPKQAYIEACNKPLPWERQKWSHAAVFHAARETGRFELHSFTESQCFPLFRANYEAMCKRAMEGESLDMPVARMLPERVPQPVSKEEAKRRCASILESIP